MQKLNENWLLEGWVDFEYKKYVLLAYLKTVKDQFEQKKLYPSFAELIAHYEQLLFLKEKKQLLQNDFPKKITRADFEKIELVYEKLVNDDDVMAEIDQIISYAIPLLKDHLKEGKDIYEYIEDKMEFSSVGLESVRDDSGFLFLTQYNMRDTKVFEYNATIFEGAKDRYRGIHLNFLEEIERSIFTTFESLRLMLLRKYRKLYVPAAYHIHSRLPVPFSESTLPVAKRLLIKQIQLI